MPSYMNNFLRYSLVLLACLSGVAQAEDELIWYDVELVIFAQKNQANLNAEKWGTPVIDTEAWDKALAIEELGSYPLRRAGGLPAHFTLLDEKNFKLNTEAERVNRSSHYELLYHTGWRQPGLPSDKAIAVRIGRSFTDSPFIDTVEVIRGLSIAEQRVPQAEYLPATHPPQVNGRQLDGTVKLILARYLHIETDLVYLVPNERGHVPATAPDANADHVQNGPDYYLLQMNESRRMRSNEVHYLDHPMFGVIAKVTPYKPEVAPEAN